MTAAQSSSGAASVQPAERVSVHREQDESSQQCIANHATKQMDWDNPHVSSVLTIRACAVEGTKRIIDYRHEP